VTSYCSVGMSPERHGHRRIQVQIMIDDPSGGIDAVTERKEMDTD
jgi:hypothetical protein